jgi:SanA protein
VNSPSRRWRWRWLAAAVAAGLVATTALVALASAHMVAAARAETAASVAAAPARPVAIVPGNRVFPDGNLSPTLERRLEVALALYRAGRVRRLFVSGASRAAEGYDEPAAMAAWLEARGVPAADVERDEGGHRTAATMADAAARGVRSALVCTQAYHLPRSLYLARAAGIDAVGVAADGAEVPGSFDDARLGVRERLARAETIVEVAVRGVTAR